MGEFIALLKKNFLVWRRNTCGCICEVATVVLFGVLMAYISTLVSDQPSPKQSYLSETITITPVIDSATVITPTDFAEHLSTTAEQMRMALMKDCSRDLTKVPARQGENDKYGFVALGPSANPIVQSMRTFFEDPALGFRVQTFETAQEIDDYINQDDYAEMTPNGRDQICFGVLLEESSSDQYTYSVHYNVSQNPEFHDVLRLEEDQISQFVREDTGQFNKQVSSGFFYLINLMDNLILREAVNTQTARINAKLTKMPVEAYETSNVFVATNSGGLLVYSIDFPVLIMFLRFIYSMLNEREKRIAQNLRNMGMSTLNYYFSWITTYFLLSLVYSTIYSLIVNFTLLPNVNFFMIWLLFFLTSMVFISFGVLIVGFFTKAKPGVLCGIILFIVFFGTEIALSSFDTLTVDQVRWFALSPVASLAKVAQGMTISQSFYQDYNFSLFSEVIQNFKYSIFFWTAILQTIILTLLGIYVDLVFPKATGVRKHPLFCFIGRKNNSNLSKEQDARKEEAARADAYEEIDEALLAQKSNKESIEIENLRKVYPNGKVAVNNLNLSMFKNQIFALLGHNGAGKTTTISMMSGLLPTTSGSIKIMGYDALEDTEKIKTIMGVCPQTNPIYPMLTCGEHLELYAKVKKTTKNKEELRNEIDQILKDIDLFDKKDFPAGKMSGGQKRKLCVACAFIGGSKVILLDEPTSGLDVAARRHLWEMLKKYKEEKIIILTTHFMDEADFLGDRIGIMGDGKLLTCGSSLFLKNKFGSGYTLTLVKDTSNVSTQEITSVVKKFVQGAKMEDDISKELKFTLPNNEIEKFQDLFIELENNKEKYGIQSFGVSLATLEDVFLKVAKDLGHNNKDKSKESKAQEILGEKELEMETVELEKIREKNASKLFMMHFGALIKKRLIYFKRDLKGLICEIILPIIVIFLGVLITLIQLIQDSGEGWINASLFDNSPIMTLSTQFTDLNNQFATESVTINTLAATTLQEFDNAIANNFNERRMFATYFDEVDQTNHIYGYNLFVNTTGGHSMNIGLNMVNDAILKLATGNSNAHIKVKFDPLILTANTRNFEGVVDGFLAVFLISLAFAFIPSSLIMFIVRERENNAKHQQIVSGVGLAAYWFSNYLVDYLKYFIVGVFTIIAFLVFDASAFIDDGAIGGSIALIFMFGFHIIAFSYLFSFAFKGPSSAQVAMFLLSILTGFILMIVAFICRVIDSTRDFSFNFLEFVWRLFPMFNICFGLFALVSARVWDGVFGLADPPGPWTRYTMLSEFIFMIIGTIICWALIFWIEMAKGSVKKDNFKPEEIEGSNGQVDEDVLKEEEEVRKNDDYAVKVQDVKKVFNIFSEGGCCGCKGGVVKKKTAVKGITFGVRKGECFGLLGTNGAGKTTTFKMLSGEIQPTTGFAKVNGMSVATDMKKIRNLIGYCPQFDALLEKMTTREHLELYAAIKGIPKNMREKMIKDSIRNLNLTKYENVQAGTYSGGNKRKLSVAIALLGNPPVVFLDEPSSGMDPEARRFMWSVVGNISTKMKTSSVILTTHSMEEAEALSTKLAIMVEGKIECLGSVQALKSKYGKGFEIDTKINLPKTEEKQSVMSQLGISDLQVFLSMDDVTSGLDKIGKSEIKDKITQNGEGNFIYNELKSKGKIVASYLVDFIVIQQHAKRLTDFLKGEFGNVEILESYQSFFKYKVVDNVQLSQLFGTMQKNKDELNLAQYSVKQTSIEQIFIGFANKRVADQI